MKHLIRALAVAVSKALLLALAVTAHPSVPLPPPTELPSREGVTSGKKPRS